MHDALRLGPLLIPFELLLVVASMAVSLIVSNRIAKRLGVEVEAVLWRALLVGIVAARLAFVFEYRSLYFAAPLTLLDIRDGGWNAGAGLVVAWLYAVHRHRAEPRSGRALRWGLAAGSALFVIGTVFLVMRPGSGQSLPDLAFSSLDGKTVRLAEFAGKPVVVNLWATWCPPCVREMPVFSAAQARYADVHFVFINQGEARDTVSLWLQARNLALPNMLIDERRQASAAFKQQGYPTTLFFDARGRLTSRRIGELSAATLDERLVQIKGSEQAPRR